jgi:hypothetical protein
MITRRSVVPSMWAMLFLAACIVLSMVITYRAGAQDAGTAKPPAAEAPAKPTRPPASKQEESATIADDPTLVPDDKESADNNVTFPVDI